MLMRNLSHMRFRLVKPRKRADICHQISGDLGIGFVSEKSLFVHRGFMQAWMLIRERTITRLTRLVHEACKSQKDPDELVEVTQPL